MFLAIALTSRGMAKTANEAAAAVASCGWVVVVEGGWGPGKIFFFQNFIQDFRRARTLPACLFCNSHPVLTG